MNGKVLRRHCNQLRKRATDDAFKILTEAFDIPLLPLNRTTQTTPENNVGSSLSDVSENKDDAQVVPVDQPLKTRPTRNRRPPRRLEMDTARKKYLIV